MTTTVSAFEANTLQRGVSLSACPGVLRVGDYLFATRWSDADWNDPYGVGFLAESGHNCIRLANEDGSLIHGVGMRAFRYAVKITGDQGKRILSEYPPREGTPFDLEVAEQIIFGDDVAIDESESPREPMP